MFAISPYDLIWSAGALVAVALTLGPAALVASRRRRPVPVKVRSSDRRG